MLYLTDKNILEIGIRWNETIDVIDKAVRLMGSKDYVQPSKPYLRFKDPKNRIVALPGYLGGDFDIAGIKWVASFPDNIHKYKDIPRAHNIVILTDANNGRPVALFNAPLLNIIRTSSVSGLIIKYFLKTRPLTDMTVGIIGWGPIGRHHFKMVMETYGENIKKVFLFDLRPIDPETIDPKFRSKVTIAKTWEEAYGDSDIFMTCTVSPAAYIDTAPKKGSLQLNTSLRDYKTDVFPYVKDGIIVDDWDEVCREKTDIEFMHNEKGLQKEDTKSIVDVVCNNAMKGYAKDQTVMFNPMGMGVFDLATGRYYLTEAEKEKIGLELE